MKCIEQSETELAYTVIVYSRYMLSDIYKEF